MKTKCVLVLVAAMTIIGVTAGCDSFTGGGRSVAVGGGVLDQGDLQRQMRRFPSAPGSISKEPIWVRIGEVTIEETISKSDRSLLPEHLESVSGWLRTELRDQVIQSPHFRVFGDWGDGDQPTAPAFEIRASVRRLDRGPEQVSDIGQQFRTNVRGNTGDAQYVEIVQGTPISFQIRLRLVSLGTAHELAPDAFGYAGEIVAIGSGTQALMIASKQSIRREATATVPSVQGQSESEETIEHGVIGEGSELDVGVEQVPTIGMIGVRTALVAMLDEANRSVFKPGLKTIKDAEADQRKAEKEAERLREAEAEATEEG